MNNLLRTCYFATFCAIATTYPRVQAEELFGDWSLRLESGTPAWMSITGTMGKPVVRFRLYVGNVGPHEGAEFSDGKLTFSLRKNKKSSTTKTVAVELVDGNLKGSISTRLKSGKVMQEAFTGDRIPPMPDKAPDLESIRFGHPIRLFNGNNLEGWRPHESDKLMGWSAQDGILFNTTPKTDFSATGAYANLRTEAEFSDFWLHLEFLVEKNRNSGVYLRGMYEAQVVDRDSRMQGIQGVGAIFGSIAPKKNAGRVGGKWQSYDLTLVDRHITVVLNGEKVIDNQPINGPTAGAIYTNPAKPGPIYLQGDHTSVKYRNIYLAPVIRDE